jgi:hypothetical protein
MDIRIMATWTTELDTTFSFPNLNVFKVLADGVQRSWRVIPQDGYVMYDTTAENWEQDGPDSEPYLVTHYFTQWNCPINFNWNHFTWVAVLRSEVDENYIFGGGNDHEVM